MPPIVIGGFIFGIIVYIFFKRAKEVINLFIDDTIAAIATAPGEGGIGIIRISGPKSLEVAEEIFFSMSGKKISEYPARTLIFGNIKDGDKKIDEVLVAYMKGPNSYTARCYSNKLPWWIYFCKKNTRTSII